MLCCPHHHPFLHFHHQNHNHHHHRRSPKPITTLHLFSSSSSTTTPTIITGCLDPQNPQNPTTTTTTTTNDAILRTHNSKSTALLLHHLNQQQQQQQLQKPKPQQQQHAIPPEEKVELQELSLLTQKRTPQFPGSLSPQSSTNTPHSPVQTLFHKESYNIEDKDHKDNGGEDYISDEEMIMKALEIRRKVTKEIFKQAMMKKGKFGITYSTNLADRLGGFLDFVMIEAAALNKLPEFQFESFNVRAMTVIEDLKVVPLIRWLKHNGLSYPKIAKLICLARGRLELITHRARWLKSIHVKGDFLGIALMKGGDNILERSDEELDNIVGYLESNGVRRDWMGYVVSRCPQLLSYSMEEIKTRVQFYLDMGINEKDFGTMVFDYPKVLGYFSLEDMNEKVNYLKQFGLSTENVGRLLAFKPELMACSIEERWKPLVKYLYYLGISQDGMRRMLLIKPMVFCIDLEKTIVPKVRFFQDIGIQDDAIGNMLVKFPPLLTYSLYKKIRRVVIFLMTEAGVSERDIGKVIASGPELLGCSIVNKLENNLKYFLSLGIHLRQLGEMIADFPMLLRYNIDLLRPKYRYLRRTMVRPLKDLIEFPRCFSYSLDERIIPRHKVLVENKINFKLRYMLACTDEEFEKKVEAAVERRRRFESGLMGDTQCNSNVADDPSEEEIVHIPENESDFSVSQTTDP